MGSVARMFEEVGTEMSESNLPVLAHLDGDLRAAGVLASVTAQMQPSPAVNEGGDCFACATLTMLKHFWPDQAESVRVADVVEWWRSAKYTDGRPAMNNHIEHADTTLYGLPSPFALEVLTDPWVPMMDRHHQPVGLVWGVQNFRQRIEAYLYAGYLGVTAIRFAPEAPHFLAPKPDGGYWNTSHDHIVLINGARTYVEGDEEPYGAHQDEVHIVCSVKGGYWIDTDELLRNHGGRFIWWVRPKRDLPWQRRAS